MLSRFWCYTQPQRIIKILFHFCWRRGKLWTNVNHGSMEGAFAKCYAQPQTLEAFNPSPIGTSSFGLDLMSDSESSSSKPLKSRLVLRSIVCVCFLEFLAGACYYGGRWDPTICVVEESKERGNIDANVWLMAWAGHYTARWKTCKSDSRFQVWLHPCLQNVFSEFFLRIFRMFFAWLLEMEQLIQYTHRVETTHMRQTAHGNKN